MQMRKNPMFRIQANTATTAQGSTTPTGPFVKNAPLRQRIPHQGIPFMFRSAHW